MSEQSPKRQKTAAMASAGGSPFDNLPPETLEAILGFLDARTLCTARLVCAQFRSAASRCIHSVELSVETLRSRPETTLANFPNLSRVTVFDAQEEDLQMLARSPVADAVTHVRAANLLNLRLVDGHLRIAAGAPLLPFPNLVSLTFKPAPKRVAPFPQTLRELILERSVTQPTAKLVAALTNLTRLRIDTSGMRVPFDAVTALTALQRLDITCGLPLLPSVAELTLLTHLHFRGNKERASSEEPAASPDPALAPLTRLHRLKHLGFQPCNSWGLNLELQLLANLGALPNLRSLDLGLWYRVHAGGSAYTALWTTPLTQLTSLRLWSYGLDLSFSPKFDVGRLQSLALSHGMGLHQDGLAALRQATSLTSLEAWWVSMSVRPEELGAALSCMPRLRALSFGAGDQFPAMFSIGAVGLPTELTRLELTGRCVSTNADLEVFLDLKKLRVLSMQVRRDFRGIPSLRITAETVFEVAMLLELSKLEIVSLFSILGGDLEDYVRAWLDAERHEKGWPPLEFNVS